MGKLCHMESWDKDWGKFRSPISPCVRNKHHVTDTSSVLWELQPTHTTCIIQSPWHPQEGKPNSQICVLLLALITLKSTSWHSFVPVEGLTTVFFSPLLRERILSVQKSFTTYWKILPFRSSYYLNCLSEGVFPKVRWRKIHRGNLPNKACAEFTYLHERSDTCSVVCTSKLSTLGNYVFRTEQNNKLPYKQMGNQKPSLHTHRSTVALLYLGVSEKVLPRNIFQKRSHRKHRKCFMSSMT